MNKRTYDQDDRLLQFSVEIIQLTEKLNSSKEESHSGGQVLRSGTSPFLTHGEAQAAESEKDFTHKLKVCLKELRETQRAIRLSLTVPLTRGANLTKRLLQESEELNRIFMARIKTAEIKGLERALHNGIQGRSMTTAKFNVSHNRSFPHA